MARIYLDAWGMKHGPDGISRYCRSLIPRLIAAAPDHEFIVIRPPRVTPDDQIAAGGAREVELKLPRADWATLAFRPALESTFRHCGAPDLYHSLFHMLPLGLTRGRCGPRSVVVTLHDLICIDRAGEVKASRLATAWVKRFDRAVIPYALHHADHVICVSEATRQRATEWVPCDRSTTIHSGVDFALFHAGPEPGAALPFGIDSNRPYVAAFGNRRPYKNVACVVRAVSAARARRPDLHLVLIGGDGGAAGEIHACGLDGQVTVTPRTTDADLRAIIAGARAFVVPSKAEGFGLPLLEAMAAGTPVAASDIPVLREIGGEAVMWFDPDQPEELARIIEAIGRDLRLRADMIARGRQRAAAFQWTTTAVETIAVYSRVLNSKPADQVGMRRVEPAARSPRSGHRPGA